VHGDQLEMTDTELDDMFTTCIQYSEFRVVFFF